MVCLFNACARLGNAEIGEKGHGFAVKVGLDSGIKACNAAMDMYVKCGQLGMARRVFEVMEERSVVSWTATLDGVVKLDGVGNGRLVFDQMNERNEVAWTIVIVGYLRIGLICESFSLLEEMLFAHFYQHVHNPAIG
ncbi:hypothetical protein ACFX15_044377 [Malus domestica]